MDNWEIVESTILGTKACSITDNVVTTSPCNGLRTNTVNLNKTYGEITINNKEGNSFINITHSENGVNVLFELNKIFNYNFKNLRGMFTHKLKTGEIVKICTVSNVGELSNQGHIIIIYPNGDIKTVYEESGCQQLISRVKTVGNNDVILYHKLTTVGSSRICEVYALISSDGFKTVVNKKIFNTSYESQCYFIEVCDDGKVLLPYFKIVTESTGEKCYLDIAITDTNFSSVRQLNQWKTADGRGLLEPKLLKVDTNNYIVISRTETGYLYKNTFNKSTETLGASQITKFASASTTFDILTVGTKNILAFSNADNTTINVVNSNHPRINIAICEVDNSFTNFDNFKLVATNRNADANYSGILPYIHSPLINVIDGTFYLSFERITETDTDTYLAVGSFEEIFRNNYTINSIGTRTITYEVPAGSINIEVLGCVSKKNVFQIVSNDIDQLGLTIRLASKNVKIPFVETDKDYITVKVYDRLYKIKLNTIVNAINNGSKYELKTRVNGKDIIIATIT